MKKLHLALFAALWIGFFSLPVLQSGCSTAPDARTQAYQTLGILGQTAKASMDASTQLLKQGSIAVAQWQQIASFYDTKWQPTYAVAVVTAKSDLSTVASPDVLALAAQFAALVAQLTAPTIH